MTARVLHRAAWLALVACGTAVGASCSLLRTPVPPNSERHAAESARLGPQLVQLDFGRDAVFAQCAPPACPTRTPKTLASEAPRQPIASAARRALDEPVAPTAAPPVRAKEAEISRTITVQFALGSAQLSPTAHSRLDTAMGDLLRAHDVTINGRTDSTGPAAFNQELALARALAVRDHLRRTHPTLAAMLTVRARGACCFIASNDTMATRAQNRRVEVVYLLSEEAPP